MKRRFRGEWKSGKEFLKLLDPSRDDWNPEVVTTIDKLLNTTMADIYFAGGFEAYLRDEMAGSEDFDRGHIERARRRAVMKIDEITRAAIKQIDNPTPNPYILEGDELERTEAARKAGLKS
jgi:hypothetical protein